MLMAEQRKAAAGAGLNVKLLINHGADINVIV